MEFLSILEMIGTVAFAMSGALKAIEKDLDIYGIAIFAITTAVGGGMIRDVLINKALPVALANPIYVIISILSALGVIFFYKGISNLGNILLIFDAIGLGAFTALGAEVGIESGLQQPFVIITLSILTGTGGGTLRDVFAGEIPVFFRKGFYALAALIGSVVFILLYEPMGNITALYASFAVTVMTRITLMQKDIKLKKEL